MARHRRGRRRRRGRRSNGNWFTRLSLAKKIGVCVSGVFMALAVSGIAFAAYKLSKLDTEEIPVEDIQINEEVEKQDLGTGYLNVALFGVDSRSNQLDKGTRTDCIIVASLNKETKEIKMVSVYRDTVLDIGGGTLQKCNAAYAFGGPTDAINMLNRNLDLDIQQYVTVDWSAISNAIDLLGGLDIEIKEEEVKYLNKFVNETARASKRKGKKIKSAGLQHLNGDQATTYARIRSTAGGDFTRTERQRLVIEKIVEQAQKSDLATLNKVIDAVFPTVKTSFSITDILYYAKSFMDYKLVDNAGFPFDKTTATISGLGSIVIPVTLDTNVAKMHEFLFGETGYTVSSTVSSLSNAIVARVGQRDATDDSELKNQTYEVSEYDKNLDKAVNDAAQSGTKVDKVDTSNVTGSGKVEKPSSGNGSSSGSGSGSGTGTGSGSGSGDNTGGGSGSGDNTGGGSGSGDNTGGGSGSGDNTGGGSGSGDNTGGGSGSGDNTGGGSGSGDNTGGSEGGDQTGAQAE